MKGMAVYAPPKDKDPATRPRRNKWRREGVGAMPRASETGVGKPRKTT